MKFPLPDNTFPTLALSSHEKREIADVAEAIVKKTIEQYNDHLTLHKSMVDKKLWKKIKHCEDVRVYKERKPSFDFAQDTASTSSESSVDSNEDVRSMASMLTFGSIPGNLDDVMYGLLNPTTYDMQFRSAVTENSIRDWSVLAPIITPSKEDPFRDLSLKWIVKGHPHLVSAVMRPRDAVFIQSNGFAQTRSGERIGYHMYHSVDIPEIPELDDLGIVRAKLSICEFFRQRQDNCVEVFGRCLINPMGGATAAMIAASTAETTVTISQEVHCAQIKKLTRIVRSKQQILSSNNVAVLDSHDSSYSLSSHSSTDSNYADSETPKQCALCNHSVGGVLSFAGTRKKHCRICLQRICARCRVYKTIYLPTEVEKELKSTDMTFCTRCVYVVTSASSIKFAELDVLAAEGKRVDYSEAL